jgi:serine/threonine protein phosphatase PrpC
MTDRLHIAIGQHSETGAKPVNQDFHGCVIPTGTVLATKGIAVALADGIGSSAVSQVASEFAVNAFVEDYYCTSDAWPVRRAMERVLAATNAWLHSRTAQGPHRFDKDRGYVCTLSGMVIKSTTAHLFHVGDSRIYRVHPQSLEQLTQDHRVQLAEGISHLSRAFGFNARIEIDYLAVPLQLGDVFLLTTDGVHDHLDNAWAAQTIHTHAADPGTAARLLVEEALRRGSDDNLTAQIVVIQALPSPGSHELFQQLDTLILPTTLPEPGALFDGFRIIRSLHDSSRSHVFLATDEEIGKRAVLKLPATDLQADPAYREGFLMEEWVARRIHNPHVVRAFDTPREHATERRHLFVALQYIEGRTLAQWMRDNPRPEVEAVRRIVEQIVRGLQAIHRLEMLHQDLRPENVMIEDGTGTAILIDLAATRVAGIEELATPAARSTTVPGTLQFTAPEHFLGETGTVRSDLFSLGVLTYQMLSGRLPYGAQIARCSTRTAQRRLAYRSVLDDNRSIPAWIDAVLQKATHIDPLRRQEALSEFVHDLRHPGAAGLHREQGLPLAARHPVRFWQGVALTLGLLLLLELASRFA